jgi:hypothetical protein
MRRTVVIASLLVAGTLHLAHAEDRAMAERYFRLGEKAYQAQNFEAAGHNFEEAYKQFPLAEIAFSAAQAYRRQYRVDSSHVEYAELSVKYYKIYLNDAKETGRRLGDAADSLGEMARVLERTGTSGKMGAPQEKKTLLGVSVVFADRTVAVAKSGMHEIDEDMDKDDADKDAVIAKTMIDGKPVELDALVDVTPGDHVVRAEAPGYKPVEQTTHVVTGVPRNVELTLQPLPAHVTVKTEEGANIIVDGRGVGGAPQAPLELGGGSHVITIVRPGRKPVAHEVTVTRDQTLTLDIDLLPTTRRRAVPWVIGVGGGVAVGFAGFFLLGAKYSDSQARDRLAELQSGNQPREVLDEYNDWKRRRDLSVDFAIISGGAAVAIGLTAAWMYYFDEPSSEGVKVVPYSSGTGGGAAISGRF